MKSKLGGLLFLLILIVLAFGLISFATEFFLGKPLTTVVEELLFLLSRKSPPPGAS